MEVDYLKFYYRANGDFSKFERYAKKGRLKSITVDEGALKFPLSQKRRGDLKRLERYGVKIIFKSKA